MKKSNSRAMYGIVVLLTILILFYIPTSPRSKSNFIPLNEKRCIYTTDIKNVTNITLILNYHDGENVTYNSLSLISDISPYNATLVALGDINIDAIWALNGVFIKGLKINGTWYRNGDDGRNWLYYVDASFPGVSSSVYELNNNSIVEWLFTGGNPYGDESTDDLWLYLGILLGVVAACAIGLFLIMKRGTKI